MNDLLYSYDGGNLWSKYNKARVFKNGTYEIKVKTKKGVISPGEMVVVSNIGTKPFPYPDVSLTSGMAGYIEGGWSNEDIVPVLGTVPSGFEVMGSITHSQDPEDWAVLPPSFWEPENFEFGNYYEGVIYVRLLHALGDVGPIKALEFKVNKIPPAGLTITGSVQNYTLFLILSASSAQTGIDGYQVSIDNGDTWSVMQPGGLFAFHGLNPGECKVKGRAYDKVGNFTESATQTYTI